MAKILGTHKASGVSVQIEPGTDRLTGKPTRHVVLRARDPSVKPKRIMTSVPDSWADHTIVNHLKDTHGIKFTGFKFTTEAKKPVAGKTVLSGKPDEIETGGGDATIKMKIKEGRALTVAQRLQRGRQIRRIKPKLQRAAKRSLIQSPSSNRIWKRSERAARNLLKKRFSPVKGVSYAKLTTTQKIYVDRALEKRQKLIKKVAKRLLPKVRAASFKRLQSYRMGSGRSRFKENTAFEDQFNQRPLPQIVESMIVNMGDHPMADSLMTLLDLASDKESPAVKSLKEKASSINVPFAEILQVYADALLEYKRTGSKLSGEQYAFNAVNSYVADQKAPTINEGFMNAVASYDRHYRAARGITESVSFRSHGAEEDGHHLLWKGQKVGDLRLVSKGITKGGHRYTLHKTNGEPVKNVRKQTVSLTMKGWQDLLHKHLTKQDQLNAMRTKTESARTPADDALDLGIQAVDMMRGKGPIKKQVANVVGTTTKYLKGSAAEKLSNMRQELKARRALHKEPE